LNAKRDLIEVGLADMFFSVKGRGAFRDLATVFVIFGGSLQEVQAQSVDIGTLEVQAPQGANNGAINNGDIQSLPMLAQRPQIGLTGTKVEDLPMSIKVVPAKTIEEQGGVGVSDALRNTSNAITGGTDATGFFDRFLIRGLDARIYNDGFSEGEQTNGLPHSMNGVQSVEVLKGPGSAMLGNGTPGGSINIAHFAPSSILGYGAGVQYGSFNTISSNYWATGATNVPGLNFRIDGLVQHADGFRGLKSAGYEIRPVFTWAVNDHFFTFAVDARHIERTPDVYGILYYQGRPLDAVSRDTKYISPFGFANQNIIRTELSDVWTVNDSLTLNNRFAYTHRASQILRNTDSDAIVGTTMTKRSLRRQDDVFDSFDYMFEPVWKFQTGGIGHTLVTGLEVQHDRVLTNQSNATLPDIQNIFSPIIPEYSASNLTFTRMGTRGLIDSLKADYLSAYITDQIDVTDQLKLRFSGRQNWWSTTLAPNIYVAGRIYEGKQEFMPGVNYGRADQPLDWNAGVLYKILPGISPFVGVARSHLANLGSESTAPAIHAPESALQYEAGVKLASENDRIQFTFSAFDINRQNVFTLVNAEPNFSSQYTRGIEGDLEVKVTPQWKISANGTIQRPIFTAVPSQPMAVGKAPIGVPLTMANLWTTYDFAFLGVTGFRVGASLQYRGKVFGDQLDSIKVPAYTIFDANITYSQPQWDVSAGIKNIADRRYYIAANGAGAFVGDPRTVYVKANVRF
jgi:iron complex outermembrane receptor protein